MALSGSESTPRVTWLTLWALGLGDRVSGGRVFP